MALKSIMHLLYDYYHGTKLCNSHMKPCNCSNYEAVLPLYLLQNTAHSQQDLYFNRKTLGHHGKEHFTTIYRYLQQHIIEFKFKIA